MAGQHAILSPSSAYRWLVCTPSARFEEQIPEEDSEFAREGTLAHDLGALYLRSMLGILDRGDEAYKREMSRIRNHEFFNKELYGYAIEYGDYVLSLGGEVLIEERFDLSEYVPCSFGTSDAVNIVEGVLYVTDLKYGLGVRVSAIENRQAMMYALGALIEVKAVGYDIHTIVISIFQPRVYSEASTWQISVDDLLDWAQNELAEKAALAIAGQGDFIAGEHCKFCKARLSCKAFYDKFAGVKKIYDARQMTEDDIIEVLKNADVLLKWVKDVKDEALRNLLNRKKIKGFKVVEGKSRRSFRNEDNVIDIMRAVDTPFEEMFDVKVKSLTGLEKALGKKRFAELFSEEVITIKGTPSLALEDDIRAPYGVLGADEYDDDNII